MRCFSRFAALFLVIVLLTAFLFGCTASKSKRVVIKGNGVVKKIEKQIPLTIQTIRLEQLSLWNSPKGVKLILHANTDAKVVVTADENILDEISVEIVGNVLSVYGKPLHDYKSKNICIDVYGQSYETLMLYLTPAVDLSTDGTIKADSLVFRLSSISGSANIEARESKIMFTAGSAGTLNLTGNVQSLNAEMTGSGKLSAFSLAASDAVLSLTGRGAADVNVSGTLNVTNSGSGDVHYKGNATLISNISGSGKVIKSDK